MALDCMVLQESPNQNAIQTLEQGAFALGEARFLIRYNKI
jgi:hypothetical protein